jgi:hypothetical protein
LPIPPYPSPFLHTDLLLFIPSLSPSFKSDPIPLNYFTKTTLPFLIGP